MMCEIKVFGPDGKLIEPPILNDDTHLVRTLKANEIAVDRTMLSNWLHCFDRAQGAIKHLAWCAKELGWVGLQDALQLAEDQIDCLLRGNHAQPK